MSLLNSVLNLNASENLSKSREFKFLSISKSQFLFSLLSEILKQHNLQNLYFLTFSVIESPSLQNFLYSHLVSVELSIAAQI